jgi:hypothetical protein
LVPRTSEAAQKVYKLGFLSGLPPITEWIAAFDKGLSDLGWIEGKNIVVESRSANGHSIASPACAPNLLEMALT